MERYFNIAGPCIPGKHYMLPALDRLPQIRRLVGREQYFVVHAPRQTGKTTAIQALVDEINAKGDMIAIYCTLETLQNATDPEKASLAIRDLILDNFNAAFPEETAGVARQDAASSDGGAGIAIRSALRHLCRRAGKPLVVFFDEADCLFGNVLISFLRQLRDGYVNRAKIPFPVSIALIGMLDVRDYKAQIRPDGESLGQISPFNIISEDMLLRNFTAEEVAALYRQHTDETGQNFAPDVLGKVMDFTGGQPWLVNALARECVEKIHDFRYGETVTADDIEAAKETIIRRRPVHIDYLFWIAGHPDIKQDFQRMVSGEDSDIPHDTKAYKLLLDLGVLCETEDGMEFSNPIYREAWEKLYREG